MAKTVEKFVVGESVFRYVGEDKWKVTVVAVAGDKVTIMDGVNRISYTPRTDGKHVKVGSPDYEVMPDMIYHPKPKAASKTKPKKVTFWQRLAGKR